MPLKSWLPSAERRLQLFLFLVTVAMVVARVLLNEKGRTNPDSIRFMRTANLLPVVDNTVTPLGYPFTIKLFTFTGLDEFWASKAIGLLALFFMVFFAWRKKFYLREMVLVAGLYSFVSIFSYTMSETLILPVMLVFLYVALQVINGKYKSLSAFLLLSAMLIVLYNIRYPALFIIGGCFTYGIWRYGSVGKPFLFASLAGFEFVIFYKIFFIDYFDERYVDTFLEIGLHPTSKLLIELFQGITTVFNPFIHIAKPGGGLINIGIYGTGAFTVALMVFIFLKQKLEESEKFFLVIAAAGFVCSFFIQYFYSVNPIDYRLMAPFSLPVWLVFFKKLFGIFGKPVYGITALSLLTGFLFTWLSRGDYLQNRRQISHFLKTENLEKIPLKFYMESEEELEKIQIAELVSTVNPRVRVTFKPSDTLQKTTLTKHKVLSKISLQTNRYQ